MSESNTGKNKIRRDKHHAAKREKAPPPPAPDANNLPSPSRVSHPRHVHWTSNRASTKDPRPRVAGGRREESSSHGDARSRTYPGRTTVRQVPLGPQRRPKTTSSDS